MGSGRPGKGTAVSRRISRLPPPSYFDTSAFFKLVVAERESGDAWLLALETRWVSSELLVTELPRAIRGRADVDPDVELAPSLARSEILLDRVSLHPTSRLALWRAGRIFDPDLRSLDAIHVATALEVRPIGAFVTYDKRQAAAAREVGLRVVSPGMRR